jgi:hypothetical protein
VNTTGDEEGAVTWTGSKIHKHFVTVTFGFDSGLKNKSLKWMRPSPITLLHHLISDKRKDFLIVVFCIYRRLGSLESSVTRLRKI